MEVMIHFPDAVSKELKQLDDANLFIVSAVQEALVERHDLEEWQKQRIEHTIQRADNGDSKFFSFDEVKSHLTSLAKNKN
jgi:hypothetical protein